MLVGRFKFPPKLPDKPDKPTPKPPIIKFVVGGLGMVIGLPTLEAKLFNKAEACEATGDSFLIGKPGLPLPGCGEVTPLSAFVRELMLFWFDSLVSAEVGEAEFLPEFWLKMIRKCIF